MVDGFPGAEFAPCAVARGNNMALPVTGVRLLIDDVCTGRECGCAEGDTGI
jgi:hypothetical protein